LNPASERFVEAARFFFADGCEHVDACGAKTLKAAAGIHRIRIVHGRDDALNAGGDDCFSAGAGAPGVIAGLEIDIECCAARLFVGGLQRDDFRVVSPFVLMKAFADNLALAHDDATHHRIGAGEAGAFAGQRQRVFHEANGVRVHGLIEKRVGVSFRVEGNHVIDLLARADKANGQSQLA